TLVLLTVDAVRPLALGLLASQAAMFALTAFVSMHWSVWAQLFARVIWPRLGVAPALEDARPARFAQLIGLVLTVLALLAFLIGVDAVGSSLTAVAAAGSVVRATTGLQDLRVRSSAAARTSLITRLRTRERT